MQPGDTAPLWRHYNDYFKNVNLAAQRGDERVIAKNTRLLQYLMFPSHLDICPLYSFFPAALRSGMNDVVLVDALMTGGRTFMLTEESAENLGLPSCIYLDLEKLGWGEGYLELRPEVKGGGTEFGRTKIDQHILEHLLSGCPDLLISYESMKEGSVPPLVFSSLAMYEGKPLGCQTASLAYNSVSNSEALLGNSEVKFIPSWVSVALPDSVVRNLRIVSSAVNGEKDLFEGVLVNELRYSAGSVRAVYFDNVESEDDLRLLCRRISTDLSELDETIQNSIEDTRRYLDMLATTTRQSIQYLLDQNVYQWAKVGDINIVFPTDYSEEYKQIKKAAWYLAKDEIVVRKIGKLFIDMESFTGGNMYYFSTSENELAYHHSLYALNVLRDHNRVCTQLRIGTAVAECGKLSYHDKKVIRSQVIKDIVEAVNLSPFLTLEISRNDVHITINYKHVGIKNEFHIPRWQIGERYM